MNPLRVGRTRFGRVRDFIRIAGNAFRREYNAVLLRCVCDRTTTRGTSNGAPRMHQSLAPTPSSPVRSERHIGSCSVAPFHSARRPQGLQTQPIDIITGRRANLHDNLAHPRRVRVGKVADLLHGNRANRALCKAAITSSAQQHKGLSLHTGYDACGLDGRREVQSQGALVRVVAQLQVRVCSCHEALLGQVCAGVRDTRT